MTIIIIIDPTNNATESLLLKKDRMIFILLLHTRKHSAMSM